METTPPNRSVTETLDLTYENFNRNKILLAKFKMPSLKAAAKTYKLPLTGTKPVLIERLQTHFLRTKSATTIQRHFRGNIVRIANRLRGPAAKNRSICVNDTDFVTMEPLSEIPSTEFFSYTDDKEFTYGFNIVSLMQLMKTQDKLSNPYNREQIPLPIQSDIFRLYDICKIIYPHMRPEPTKEKVIPRQRPRRYMNAHGGDLQNVFQNANTTNVSVLNPEDFERLHKIQEIRRHPIQQRIIGVFMEMDRLGNYTQSGWFSNLDARDFIRLYRILYELWNFRTQIPRDVQARICPFHNPFEIDGRPVHHHLSVETIQEACLAIFENLVLSGIDEDHRKLGTFQALTALTVVSMDARNAMPWLYESISY
jgi:hypothetical protein